MAIENDMEKWLRRELTRDREKVVDRLILRHASPGMKGNDVDTFTLSERTLSVENLLELAEEVLSRAQGDADGLGQMGRYVLTAHSVGESRAVARFPFRLRPNQDEFEEAGDEPANQRGLLTQLMRHNEALAKTMVHAVAGITTVMARRLESSDNAITRLTENAQKNLLLLEEAKSEQHGRDLELLEVNRKAEREEKIFEKLSLLVPVVINKLAGQKVFNAEDPSALMLRTFTESISTDQFNKIQSTLNQEQIILLAQIIQSSKKALPPANGTSS